MSLYIDEIVDPIAAMDGRELDFIPRHFHSVVILPVIYNMQPIRNWIWKNLHGRFCLTSRIRVVNNQMISDNVACFEDSGEAIMFSFMMPNFKSESDVFDLF